MFYRLLLSLITGIIATLFLAQHDPWTQTQLCTYLTRACQQSYGCRFSFDNAEIRLLSPRIIVTNLHAIPDQSEDDSWQWQCRRCAVSSSWLQLLRTCRIAIAIELNNLEITSRMHDNQLAILPHLRQLCANNNALPLPTAITSVHLANAHLRVSDPDAKHHGTMKWNSETKLMRTGYRSTMQITDGSCTYADRQVYSQAIGNLQTHLETTGEWSAQIAGKLNLDYLSGGPSCYLSGSWNKASGHFTLHDLAKNIYLDPVIVTTTNDGFGFRLNGQLPAAQAAYLVHNTQQPSVPIDGTVALSAHGTLGNQQTARGQLAWHGNLPTGGSRDNAKLSFTYRNGSWSGHCVLHGPWHTELDGNWHWNGANGGAMILSNAIDLQSSLVPHWHIRPRDALLKLSYSHNDGLDVQHTCSLANELAATQCDARGSISVTADGARARGTVGHYQYQSTADLSSTPFFVTSAQVTDEQGTTTLQINRAAEHNTSTEIHLPVCTLRTGLASLYGSDLQGEGTVLVKLGRSAAGSITAQVSLAHGVIRLPQTHNFIDGFDAHCTLNIAQRQLLLDSLTCSLHSGFVSAAHGHVRFSEQGAPTTAYLPLTFDRCLLNMKQDLFASLSGSLTYTLKPLEQPTLSGFVVVERAQLKENLLWQELQEQVLKPSGSATNRPFLNPQLDVKIATKEPIIVDTGFLQTNARATLRLSNTARDPHIRGSISLTGGSLAFAYKPLLISNGTITFAPPQIGNSNVELVAKNRVKKYDVQLHVNGTLRDQQVSLESSPPLTEEQIVALLLVGSDEEALNIMAPLLLAQNARDLLFGSHKNPRLAGGPGTGPRPFRVAFVPSFTDQTARGGLRGGIEITAYDRWRALIQKNFSLTEDTRFELEYAVTDDVTARCTRDERRDIAGEIEMRWKF